jgi:uncharacterized iron-regulated protein
MIMRKVITCLILFVPLFTAAQLKEPYALFDAKGKKISYEKLIQISAKADVVLFGELHNNTFAHWLELQVLKDLHKSGENVAVGMEMFETDDQLVIDEYVAKLIEEKQFIKEAKFWDNYKSDYRPLVEFARVNNLNLVATNVPRRYANLVYRKGLASLDSLPSEAKSMIVPLPLAVDYSMPNYKSMMEGMSQHGSGTAENLVASQALKDATMAHSILKYHKEGQLFYHVNGSYHSQDYQGIVTYLKKTKPDLNIVTIHIVEQEAIKDLEKANTNRADFTFCIVDDMIKSY